jgi:hypothetical protein
MPFTQAAASTLFCVNNCGKLKILVLGCPLKTAASIPNFVKDCHLVLKLKFRDEDITLLSQ